ncbi:MAG: DNA replication/repair protein RecF, partial [Hyphomicrobiales bacterium]|nr:DNA replication/repair protein RecF [Hyphomicrobiales bacterium]
MIADADVTGASPSVAVRRLRLTDFRNYASLDLETGPRPVVLIGANGAGKTNLLEAVSFLSPGRGLRRATYDEVARIRGAGGWAVAAKVDGGLGPVDIGTGLGVGADGNPDRQRRILIEHVAAKSAEALLDHLRVSWLTPAMDGLFTGPAGDRRRFLDRMVLAIDTTHAGRVNALDRALRSRNRLLEDARPDAAWLDAIEAQIAELGIAVAAARHDLVGRLAAGIDAAHDPDSPFPHAELGLSGAIEAEIGTAPAIEIEDAYRARLAAARAADARAGRTLEGPHRA